MKILTDEEGNEYEWLGPDDLENVLTLRYVPRTYEFGGVVFETRSARPPKTGEWFLGSSGQPALAMFDFDTVSYAILQPIDIRLPLREGEC